MRDEDRFRHECRVITDLVRLTASDHQYADVIRAILDRLEELFPSPLICISIGEFGEVGHYARAGVGTDDAWAEDASRVIAEVQERWLEQSTPASYQVPTPSAGPYFRTFPAWSRSGRAGALVLGSPAPIVLTREDEQLLGRLAEQVLLVLDHALLLQQIERLETTDPLTGMVNHQRLLDVLDSEMQRHRYTGKSLALLLLDIDGLAAINQSYGRQYGNHILSKLATLVRATVRPIDVVARCGLDEFAVLLPETGEDEALTLVDALRERLLTVEFAGGDVGLTVAIGIAKPGEVLTPESLLQRGEHALSETKRQQRAQAAVLAARG